MIFFWKRILVFGLLAETILFLVLYCFGPNGLHVLYKLKKQRVQALCQINDLKHQVEILNHTLALSKNPFYKEKIARERLFMKKDGEVVYFKL